MYKMFLFVALILGANTAQADTIQTFDYFVSGDVGTQAGVPLGSFSFDGVPIYSWNDYASGAPQFTAPGSFLLGEFTPRSLPANSSLTYTNLPFYITISVSPSGQNPFLGGDINITGVLNGTVSGSGSSTVIASIQSITSFGHLPFPLADFKIDAPQVLSGSEPTNLIAQLEGLPQPIPEPSALATILIGLVFTSRLRRHRWALGMQSRLKPSA